VVGEGSFVPQSTGVYYFAFHGYSNPNQNKLFVDDVNIEKNLITNTSMLRTTEMIKISPNPCHDWINVEAPEMKDAELKIMDQTGRVIFSMSGFSSSERINVTSFAKGIYLLQLSSNHQNYTTKFVVD
jgi:hypothetical protein